MHGWLKSAAGRAAGNELRTRKKYVSDRDARFKQPSERCTLLTRWAFEYFDQTGLFQKGRVLAQDWVNPDALKDDVRPVTLSIIIICPGLDSRPGPPSSTCWRAWSVREGRC